MEWLTDNNLLSLKVNENTIFIPDAASIYEALKTEVFEFNNEKIKLPTETIRFAKIGGLNCLLTIDLSEDNIKLLLAVTKNDTTYFVPFIDNHFVDNILINNTWYFLTGNFQSYKDILSKISVNPDSSISYKDYMELSKTIIESKIEVQDNVIATLSTITNEDSYYMPRFLKGKLYEYQKIGCNWLSFMARNGCGAILADEMGLGKTLQIIALFAYMKETGLGKNFLVIAPLSLIINWEREILKFYPSFNILIHHGQGRTGYYTDLLKYDVIITTYGNALTDFGMLNMIDWDCIALDEAQNIKNPNAQRTKVIKNLNKKRGIAITGTPFENHMTDIWSLVDYVFPEYLGSLNTYNSMFTDTDESAVRIEEIITPIMIRRRVKDVAQDLPERIDIPQPIVMTEQEASYYDRQRNDINKQEALMKLSLDVIQKLRMFCTHPSVYDNSLAIIDPVKCSNKYQRLCEIVEEIIENNEKVIIFTSFNNMISLIEEDFSKRYGIYTNYINGSVSGTNRQAIIDEFSNIEGAAVLVLNPKAAGTGLNITAANHVIHYNLEWNPALEDQATARAYRRGQNNTVFVHRLYYVKTIEEIINDRIDRKRNLSERAIIGNNGETDKEDLLKALSMSPYGEY